MEVWEPTPQLRVNHWWGPLGHLWAPGAPLCFAAPPPSGPCVLFAVECTLWVCAVTAVHVKDLTCWLSTGAVWFNDATFEQTQRTKGLRNSRMCISANAAIHSALLCRQWQGIKAASHLLLTYLMGLMQTGERLSLATPGKRNPSKTITRRTDRFKQTRVWRGAHSWRMRLPPLKVSAA